MEKNAQIALKQNYFSPDVWGQMKTMAETFIQSHALPKNIENAAQAIMIMQAGYEMGMKPMEAIKSLYIVNGQINVWGPATMRRLKEHGYTPKYVMSADKGGSCTATVKKGKEVYTETYSFDSASKSGYTTDSYNKLKVGWREGINRNMKLRYGAISMIIKSYLPEVLGSASEIMEVAEDYIIEENPAKAITTSEKPNQIVSPVELRPSLDKFIEENKKKPTMAGVKIENKESQERLSGKKTREEDIKEKTDKLTNQVKMEGKE